MSTVDPGADDGAAESLALAERAGIHRLAVPTPFLVGRVNCYLIEDEPLTLVDTGPNSGKSLDELEQALAHHGHAIEDLELIVITHQHMDHVGLLEILARRSKAEVAALHLLGPYLENFGQSAIADDEFSQAIMRRYGIPSDLTTVLGSVGAAFRAFGSSGHIDRRLHDGDVLSLRDRSLRIFHRPGHSPSDTIFWDEERKILIAGDHLLAHISSNPLVSRPLAAIDADVPPARPRALIDYLSSMRATRELPAELVLSGHGSPIRDPGRLIEERFRMLEEGPLSGYEVALRMWGNIAVTQAYLTLSEVLGHMDLLIAEERVEERMDGEIVRFYAV